MPIETICKGCARKLRVADEYAGRKARCPHCKSVYEVPSVLGTLDADQLGSGHQDSDHQSDGFDLGYPAAKTSSGEMWHMRTADGAVYGPATRSELDEWCREGRIAMDSELRQEGSTGWVKAIGVYPSLAAPAATGVADTNPFAATATASNTFQSATPAQGYYGQQHRGGMILTFGIISWVGCVSGCILVNLGFAIAAWTMGRADLAAMRAGQMDPSGQGQTQTGMILGMVNVIVCAAGFALWVAFVVVAAIADS